MVTSGCQVTSSTCPNPPGPQRWCSISLAAQAALGRKANFFEGACLLKAKAEELAVECQDRVYDVPDGKVLAHQVLVQVKDLLLLPV